MIDRLILKFILRKYTLMVKEIYSNGNWPGYPKHYMCFIMVLIVLQIQKSVGM
jgi:hypothetical protein